MASTFHCHLSHEARTEHGMDVNCRNEMRLSKNEMKRKDISSAIIHPPTAFDSDPLHLPQPSSSPRQPSDTEEEG